MDHAMQKQLHSLEDKNEQLRSERVWSSAGYLRR
jgi:hypothetical protein